MCEIRSSPAPLRSCVLQALDPPPPPGTYHNGGHWRGLYLKSDRAISPLKREEATASIARVCSLAYAYPVSIVDRERNFF